MSGARVTRLPPRWSGRDVETALTIGVALLVGLLGVVGVVDQGVVGAATLSILALICFDVIASRGDTSRVETAVHKLTGAVAALRRHPRGHAVTVLEAGTLPELGQARDIRMVGVTLNRTIRNQLPALEQCLTGGGSIQVVIIDRASSAVREAARRNGLPADPYLFENRLHPTIDLLRYLAAMPGGNGELRVRFTNYVPSFGLIMVDPDTPYGRLAVDVYSHRPGGCEPMLALSLAQDLQWYRHFQSEFDQIWASARSPGIADGL